VLVLQIRDTSWQGKDVRKINGKGLLFLFPKMRAQFLHGEKALEDKMGCEKIVGKPYRSSGKLRLLRRMLFNTLERISVIIFIPGEVKINCYPHI